MNKVAEILLDVDGLICGWESLLGREHSEDAHDYANPYNQPELVDTTTFVCFGTFANRSIVV